MCGIAGILRRGGLGAADGDLTLRAMAGAIASRGPDGEGFWRADAEGVALCHRRLAIIDVSALGHQPMASRSERYVVTFNGEIYNFRELRTRLAQAGHQFRGGSDTEVLLAAIDEWGVAAALQQIVGMFAFGVWDREERVLHLARDRFGEKPLYVAQFGGVLLFGSELKALRQHAAFRAEIDRDALALLVRHDFIPAPHSIFVGVSKLRPGEVMSVRARAGALSVDRRLYFDAASEVGAALRNPFTGTPEEAVDEMEAALKRAVGRQMVSDVPLGAFLSGGIDSSLVVALMQSQSAQPVRTFSIGSTDPAYDESAFAARVASHLGTQHTAFTVTGREALDIVPTLPEVFDEPFGDSSQIPTILVSRLARRDVTVSLSGDAGDELFGGYRRYFDAMERWAKISRCNGLLRAAAAAAIQGVPSKWLQSAISLVSAPTRFRGRTDTAWRMQDRAYEWRCQSFQELYYQTISMWRDSTLVVPGATERATVANERGMWPDLPGPLQHAMFVDLCHYLPGDILTKVDRSAMSASLETRVPMLDPEVVSMAWRIPGRLHVRDGRGKWILRQVLSRYVPTEIFDRPKMGFAVPVAQWLRTDLREWASELLDVARLRREGLLNAELVSRRWTEHLAGGTDWSFHLWSVLMFQAWQERWMRG